MNDALAFAFNKLTPTEAREVLLGAVFIFAAMGLASAIMAVTGMIQ